MGFSKNRNVSSKRKKSRVDAPKWRKLVGFPGISMISPVKTGNVNRTGFATIPMVSLWVSKKLRKRRQRRRNRELDPFRTSVHFHGGNEGFPDFHKGNQIMLPNRKSLSLAMLGGGPSSF